MTVIPFAKPDKAAAERDALIRQARAIYESVFPTVLLAELECAKEGGWLAKMHGFAPEPK